MNRTVFASYEGCKAAAIKLVAPRGKAAQLTGGFALLQDKSAHTTVLNASYHMHTS